MSTGIRGFKKVVLKTIILTIKYSALIGFATASNGKEISSFFFIFIWPEIDLLSHLMTSADGAKILSHWSSNSLFILEQLNSILSGYEFLMRWLYKSVLKAMTLALCHISPLTATNQ